jgi:hypothetical protein
MAQASIHKPSRILRGTWEQVLAHRDDIAGASEVELRVFEPGRQTATMALMRDWLEEDATDDPEELRAAEAELRDFKRNMNLPRREAGARLLYPEVE